MRTDDELTGEETAALRSLADGPPPPGELEDRTLARLTARGLLVRRRRSGWIKAALAAAAGLLIFFAGLKTGARPIAPPAAPTALAGSQFVLLLYQSPQEVTLAADVEALRVEEYVGWARRLRAAGRDVSGEKLEEQRSMLQPPAGFAVDAGSPLIDGFFIISAGTLDEALGVARTCPHLKYGGAIEVRPVAGV